MTVDVSVFIALKLMQAVMARVNEVCLRYQDNSKLDSLPPPAPLPRESRTVAAAIKNMRRTMEDRHVVIGNLEALFGIEVSKNTVYTSLIRPFFIVTALYYCALQLLRF